MVENTSTRKKAAASHRTVVMAAEVDVAPVAAETAVSVARPIMNGTTMLAAVTNTEATTIMM